jgi:hypothetical protein
LPGLFERGSILISTTTKELAMKTLSKTILGAAAVALAALAAGGVYAETHRAPDQS